MDKTTNAQKEKSKSPAPHIVFSLAGVLYVVAAILRFIQNGSNDSLIPFTTTCGILFFNFAILFRKGLLRPKKKDYKPIKEKLFIVVPLAIYAILTIIFNFSQNAESSPIILLIVQIVLPVVVSISFAVGIDSICENTKRGLVNSHGTTKIGHGRKG